MLKGRSGQFVLQLIRVLPVLLVCWSARGQVCTNGIFNGHNTALMKRFKVQNTASMGSPFQPSAVATGVDVIIYQPCKDSDTGSSCSNPSGTLNLSQIWDQTAYNRLASVGSSPALGLAPQQNSSGLIFIPLVLAGSVPIGYNMIVQATWPVPGVDWGATNGTNITYAHHRIMSGTAGDGTFWDVEPLFSGSTVTAPGFINLAAGTCPGAGDPNNANAVEPEPVTASFDKAAGQSPYASAWDTGNGVATAWAAGGAGTASTNMIPVANLPGGTSVSYQMNGNQTPAVVSGTNGATCSSGGALTVNWTANMTGPFYVGNLVTTSGFANMSFNISGKTISTTTATSFTVNNSLCTGTVTTTGSESAVAEYWGLWAGFITGNGGNNFQNHCPNANSTRCVTSDSAFVLKSDVDFRQVGGAWTRFGGTFNGTLLGPGSSGKVWQNMRELCRIPGGKCAKGPVSATLFSNSPAAGLYGVFTSGPDSNGVNTFVLSGTVADISTDGRILVTTNDWGVEKVLDPNGNFYCGQDPPNTVLCGPTNINGGNSFGCPTNSGAACVEQTCPYSTSTGTITCGVGRITGPNLCGQSATPCGPKFVPIGDIVSMSYTATTDPQACALSRNSSNMAICLNNGTAKLPACAPTHTNPCPSNLLTVTSTTCLMYLVTLDGSSFPASSQNVNGEPTIHWLTSTDRASCTGMGSGSHPGSLGMQGDLKWYDTFETNGFINGSATFTLGDVLFTVSYSDPTVP